MRKLLFVCVFVGSGMSWGAVCPLSVTQKKVIQAALAIEKLNTGGGPLTTQLYSYSSRPYSWGVVLSYSGVQTIWTVQTSNDGCLIKSVSHY